MNATALVCSRGRESGDRCDHVRDDPDRAGEGCHDAGAGTSESPAAIVYSAPVPGVATTTRVVIQNSMLTTPNLLARRGPRILEHGNFLPSALDTLAIVYLVLAIVGLGATWTFNILAIVSRSDFVGEWMSNGFATQSLQVDLLVLAVAVGMFLIVEARRIGMRHAWVFLPLAAVTAAAFAIPLFLALRERGLAGSLSTTAD